MPIYEYQCEVCKHQQEKIESMSAETIQDCPACSGVNKFIRCVSRTAFTLSGDSWFAGGYGAPGVSETKPAPKKEDAAPAKLPESPGTSKPTKP